jgi:hypothetical protein
MDFDPFSSVVENAMAACFGANSVDVSAAVHKTSWMPDVYIPEMGIIAECKYSAIENLVSVSQDNAYSLSGQYLQSLFEAQKKLLAARKEADERFRDSVARLHSDTHQIYSPLPFDRLLEIFNQQAEFTYISSVGMLQLLLAGKITRNFLRRVFVRISKIPKAGKLARPSYRGFSWSRRTWFLLHGSHPPKTEGCLAFGYAVIAI